MEKVTGSIVGFDFIFEISVCILKNESIKIMAYFDFRYIFFTKSLHFNINYINLQC